MQSGSQALETFKRDNSWDTSPLETWISSSKVGWWSDGNIDYKYKRFDKSSLVKTEER